MYELDLYLKKERSNIGAIAIALILESVSIKFTRHLIIYEIKNFDSLNTLRFTIRKSWEITD